MMNAQRCMAWLLMIGLVCTSTPASAKERSAPPTVREIVEAARAANVEVAVEVDGGSIVSGHIGATDRTRFHILDGTARGGRAIAYASTRAFVDTATGERLAVQAPGPTTQMPGNRSFKFLLIVGIAVGALIVLYYAIGGNKV